MEKILIDKKVAVLIYRNNDWTEGLNFITTPETNIQVGSWWYPKGKVLDKHYHNESPRTANKTQEMVYVKKGKMRVLIYDSENSFSGDFILNEGDLAVMLDGGHGYEILENDTQIIESKNGPFLGVENDKTRF